MVELDFLLLLGVLVVVALVESVADVSVPLVVADGAAVVVVVELSGGP